jgi:integrase/recombinase XerD
MTNGWATTGVSPHAWRHSCATHLVAGGANLAYVQRLLGHRSLRTTQVYTRVAVPELKTTHCKTHPRR